METEDKYGIVGAVGCFLGSVAADHGLFITTGVLWTVSVVLLMLAYARRK